MSLVAALASGCGGRSNALVPIGAGLSGPPGLTASVYATGVPLAAAFAFDRHGRLWVAVSGLDTHTTDGVYLIRRRGAKPVEVASGLKAPLGLVWIGDRLLVSSLGRVTAFTELHGDHFRVRRTLLEGPVAGGENNNLVRAPDGRLLLGVSASCDHCTPSSRYSAAIVSFEPDGSDMRVYAGGIRAAFGLAFVPGTNDLLASMNQRDDLGARTPGDWLGLVRAGESWGFPRCYGQDGSPCARVPAPIAVLDKHAAAGGIAVLTRQLGGRFAGSVLVAEWNSGKVLRVTLAKTANGYRGSVKPFLTGLKNPLPVIATAGGAVLVGDWQSGTIYEIAAG